MTWLLKRMRSPVMMAPHYWWIFSICSFWRKQQRPSSPLKKLGGRHSIIHHWMLHSSMRSSLQTSFSSFSAILIDSMMFPSVLHQPEVSLSWSRLLCYFLSFRGQSDFFSHPPGHYFHLFSLFRGRSGFFSHPPGHDFHSLLTFRGHNLKRA